MSERSSSINYGLEAIVFDFDGTLANSFPMFLAVFTSEMEKNLVIRQETVKELTTDVFLSVIDKEQDRQNPSILLLKVFYHTCRKLGLNRYSSLLRTLYSGYKIKKQYKNIELFEGAKEILEELHNEGIPLILVTHSSKKSVLEILEKSHLEHYFNIILDRKDLEGAEKTQGIIEALSAYGISPKNALAIGDLPADILEAKAAGVKTVAVTTGPVTKNRLLAAGPDILIENLTELREYLKEI